MKRVLKKILFVLLPAVLLVSILAVTLAACEPTVNEKGTIGILMPTQSLQRWNQDGSYLKEKFRDEGYDVDLKYANNKEADQISQLDAMVTKGVKAVVVCPIKSGSLNNALEKAAEKGIKIIAYDRMLTDTVNIDYYVTFDNYQVGVSQGKFIEEKLNLKTATVTGPFNIEFIAGDPDDTNATLFFNGAMDTLKSYMEGTTPKLVVPSGKITFAAVATKDWSTQTAATYFSGIITTNSYKQTPGSSPEKSLHAVCASNDSTAQGVKIALENAGFTPGAGYPILTGQDCDKVSVQNMINGWQTMSIFKDTRILAAQAVKMTIQALEGKTVDVNVDPKVNTDYNNGKKDVPTYLCKIITTTLDSMQADLFDTFYYYASDFSGTWPNKPA